MEPDRLPPTISRLKSDQMTTLASLPIELCPEILELLKPQESNAPIVGLNGCWTKMTTVVEQPPANHKRQHNEPWATALGSRLAGRSDPSALWNLRK